MMSTVPHVTSGLGLRKFQADRFLLTRVYKSKTPNLAKIRSVGVALIYDERWSETQACRLADGHGEAIRRYFAINQTRLKLISIITHKYTHTHK